MNTGYIIQVAGIIDQQEAGMILAAGATHLGFPLRLDVHREDLSEAAAAAIIRRLPDPAMAVLITYLNHATEILRLTEYLGCGTVQLHGHISPAALKALRTAAPELQIWKSLVISKNNTEELQALAIQAAPYCDAFITDTYDPETGASGATGKTHDWAVSRRLVQSIPRPVILAGGLNAENVTKAIEAVCPAGVDAHTGLEDQHGRKDPRRVSEFVRNARKAFGSL